jgi:hypothetical protein
MLFWKDAENMHFVPRQHMALRFSEINCHAGCTRCNHFLNGNIEEYVLHLKKDYGNDIVEKLTIAKRKPNKISEAEYRTFIASYEKEIKKLKREKKL